jgi:hypothetical protein
MDQKAKEEVLKNIERLMSATTSGDIKKIEQETVQIIRKSSDFSEKKPARENE